MPEIQILGIRSRIDKDGNVKKSDTFYENAYRAQTVKDLFENIDKYIEQLPQEERFNMFFTAAECGDLKREFAQMCVLPFDLDGPDLEKKEQYIDIFCNVLDIKKEHTATTCSGNGFQFFIGLQNPIKTKEYFNKNRVHYKMLLLKLNKALRQATLPGLFDGAVFDSRRLMRLPNTVNKKDGKKDRLSYVIQPNIKDIDFDLSKRSGIPNVAKKDFVPKDFFKKYPSTDAPTVLKECMFLAWCKDNPNSVTEPMWYAALSILSRIKLVSKSSDELCHEYSKGYKLYSKDETDLKIEQARNSAGPRTCENINSLQGWERCSDCPHFEHVSSPILLKSKNHLRTKDTGFRNVSFNEKTGKVKVGKPNYDELVAYYNQLSNYKNLNGSEMILVFKGSHYEITPTAKIRNFALKTIHPSPVKNEVQEFIYRIHSTNITEENFWEDSVKRKINFKNGVLDFDSMKFGPHDPKYGFRYVLPYEYNPDAKAPNFEKMLRAITQNDDQLQQVIKEFGGYCLSNDSCWTNKALVLVGEGANGKSTLMNVLRSLAGLDNYSSLSLTDLRSEYSRQMLDGKLFNLSEEIPTKTLVESSIFKNLVTGGEVQVRSPYKQPYFVRNKAKLIFSCNELPKTTDSSFGFFRRLLLVPFNKKFVPGQDDYDPFIEGKLLKELPGIFNIMLKGYKDLRAKESFTDSERINAEIEAYRKEVDNVITWVDENLEVYPSGNGHDKEFVALNTIYQAYSETMKMQGLDALDIFKFSKRLSKKMQEDFDRNEISHTSTASRGYSGVMLRDVCGF